MAGQPQRAEGRAGPSQAERRAECSAVQCSAEQRNACLLTGTGAAGAVLVLVTAG